jgi:hypothetical protein
MCDKCKVLSGWRMKRREHIDDMQKAAHDQRMARLAGARRCKQAGTPPWS